MQLNDTHLLLLSAAAQRADNLLVRPDELRGKAAEHLARRFETAGLVEAVPVGGQDPLWRKGEDGASIGFRLLAAGAKAIGVEVDVGSRDEALGDGAEPSADNRSLASPPRGAKRSVMLALLQRQDGASVADIMQATGWLPHSTRAALTGLRKAGHHIDRSKTDAGQTVYRLIGSDAAAEARQDSIAATRSAAA